MSSLLSFNNEVLEYLDSYELLILEVVRDQGLAGLFKICCPF